MRFVRVWALCVGLLGAGMVRAEPVVREELRVVVDGVTERWRLEWRAPPEISCFETEVVTCPCEGFAQAERGELDLVRVRPGAPDERMALSSLFDPGAGETRPLAMLRGWMPSKRDLDQDIPEEQRKRELPRRKRARAMVLADYDHDGQAREFVLQTDASGCGLRFAVLIGVDRRDGRLRALGSAEHPEHPLVLEPHTWEKLRAAKRIESIQTPCGDHGSDMEEVIRAHADARGLHVTRELYQCTEKLERGARTDSEVL